MNEMDNLKRSVNQLCCLAKLLAARKPDRLRSLSESNRNLSMAKDNEQTARNRLEETIRSIHECRSAGSEVKLNHYTTEKSSTKSLWHEVIELEKIALTAKERQKEALKAFAKLHLKQKAVITETKKIAKQIELGIELEAQIDIHDQATKKNVEKR